MFTFDQEFTSYFIEHIHPDIEKMASWALKKVNIDLQSLTTNQSESLNAVIKRITEFKEHSVDHLVFKLYELACSYNNKIILGRYQKGQYIIRENLRHLYNPNESGIELPRVVTYEQVMKNIEQQHSDPKVTSNRWRLSNFHLFSYV